MSKPTGHSEVIARLRKAEGWNDKRAMEPDEDFDDFVCSRCHNDGMDPWCDYLLPCPACQGEQRP